MNRLLVAISLALLCAACGTSSSPMMDASAGGGGDGASSPVDAATSHDSAPAMLACSVSGSITGMTVNAKDCLSSVDPGGGGTDILIADFAGACPIVGNGAWKASSKSIDIHFSASTTVAAGTFNAPADVDVQYANYDATCMSPNGASASSGTVTISRADATGIDGTFDVMFNGDHVTASFHAPNCVGNPPDGATACQQ